MKCNYPICTCANVGVFNKDNCAARISQMININYSFMTEEEEKEYPLHLDIPKHEQIAVDRVELEMITLALGMATERGDILKLRDQLAEIIREGV